MQRVTVLRRTAVALVALIVVVALVAVALGVSVSRRALPQTSGEVDVPGLSGRVTVIRDGLGVPHISGDSLADIARAQGYVMAQDRFFQMDLTRHYASGRLAELVGASGVGSDRLVRSMGWRQVAEKELPTLSPRTRRYLRAYSDGVNAYLSGRTPDQVAFEYSVLGLSLPDYAITEWSPVDSLVALRAMAWDLRQDYRDELTRARLATRVPMAQIAELYPDDDSRARPPIVGRQDWQPPVLAETAAAAARPGSTPTTGPGADIAYAAAQRVLDAAPPLLSSPRAEGVGSNSWVLAGTRTTTGKPLLANDPHLKPGQPGTWYQNALSCRTVSPSCPLEVSGFSLPGVPGVVIGHNAHLAWGFTNLPADVTDFYLERVDASERYLRDGAWMPLQTRTETITVRGGTAQRLVVRSTGHGPLLSDIDRAVNDAGQRAPVVGQPAQQRPDNGYDVALSWTGLEPSQSADAIIGFDLATTPEQFRAAARLLAVPAQNLVYADTEGHIGYQAPGRFPVRRSAVEGAPPGFWPAPGWDSAYDWTGDVPFERLPHVEDPREGFVVAANQQVSEASTPFLTSEWDPGWRAQRIRELLVGDRKLGPQDLRAIQLDTRNGFAPTLTKALLEVPLKNDTFTREAQDLLRGWDYTNPADGSTNAAAAAYYNAVWANLLRLTFDDELPTGAKADGGGRYMVAVAALLTKPKSGWWDNKLTADVVEGKAEILRSALKQARLQLTRELGKDPASWRWGKLHRLTLRHPVLGSESSGSPWFVRWLVNQGEIDMAGGSAVIDATSWDAAHGYGVVAAPSMRMVVDLADLDASTWVNQTGVSGHPFSGHYDDQTPAWADGEQEPWPFSRKAVEESGEETLTLVPKPSAPAPGG